MGFPKLLIGGVAYIGTVLLHAAFSVLFANLRLPSSLQVIGKRGAARSVEQRLQMCVATNTGCKAVAIGLPKRIDAGVASLLTHLPAAITFAIVQVGSFTLSSSAFRIGRFGSFLWHAHLQF